MKDEIKVITESSKLDFEYRISKTRTQGYIPIPETFRVTGHNKDSILYSILMIKS